MQADVGLLVGDGVRPAFSGQLFNGIKIDKYKVEAGVLLGADVYRQFTLLPVTAGLKWLPIESKSIIPYVSLNVGYGFNWLKKDTDEITYEGGAVINPQIGIRIKTTGKLKLNFGAGFKQQHATVYQRYEDESGSPITIITEKYKLGRLSLNVGASF